VVVGDAIRSIMGKHQEGNSAAVAAQKDCEVHAVRRQSQGEGAHVHVPQGAIGSWSVSGANRLKVEVVFTVEARVRIALAQAQQEIESCESRMSRGLLVSTSWWHILLR